jgi:hypothetical protein
MLRVAGFQKRPRDAGQSDLRCSRLFSKVFGRLLPGEKKSFPEKIKRLA